MNVNPLDIQSNGTECVKADLSKITVPEVNFAHDCPNLECTNPGILVSTSVWDTVY